LKINAFVKVPLRLMLYNVLMSQRNGLYGVQIDSYLAIELIVTNALLFKGLKSDQVYLIEE